MVNKPLKTSFQNNAPGLSGIRMAKRAREIMYLGHQGQKVRNGDSYADAHSRIIGEHFKGEDTFDAYVLETVGYLHDLLENNKKWNRRRLKLEGFPDVVLDALDAVSRNKPEDAPREKYLDFIVRCAANPYARKVKIVDMMQNMDRSRTSELVFSKKHAEKKQLYTLALPYLQAVEAGDIEPGTPMAEFAAMEDDYKRQAVAVNLLLANHSSETGRLDIDKDMQREPLASVNRKFQMLKNLHTKHFFNDVKTWSTGDNIDAHLEILWHSMDNTEVLLVDPNREKDYTRGQRASLVAYYYLMAVRDGKIEPGSSVREFIAATPDFAKESRIIRDILGHYMTGRELSRLVPVKIGTPLMFP